MIYPHYFWRSADLTNTLHNGQSFSGFAVIYLLNVDTGSLPYYRFPHFYRSRFSIGYVTSIGSKNKDKSFNSTFISHSYDTTEEVMKRLLHLSIHKIVNYDLYVQHKTEENCSLIWVLLGEHQGCVLTMDVYYTECHTTLDLIWRSLTYQKSGYQSFMRNVTSLAGTK